MSELSSSLASGEQFSIEKDDSMNTEEQADDPIFLENVWQMFYTPGITKGAQTSKDDFESLLRTIGDFDTVELFWDLWNLLFDECVNSAGVIYLFKKGIKPVWEDSSNVNGGKFSFFAKSHHIDWIPLSVTLAVIGEQLSRSDDINGVVLSFRPIVSGISGGCFVSVWSKSSDNPVMIEVTVNEIKAAVHQFPHEKNKGIFEPNISFKKHGVPYSKNPIETTEVQRSGWATFGERKQVPAPQIKNTNNSKKSRPNGDFLKQNRSPLVDTEYQIEIVDEEENWTTVQKKSEKKTKTKTKTKPDTNAEITAEIVKQDAPTPSNENNEKPSSGLTRENLAIHDKKSELVDIRLNVLKKEPSVHSWADDAEDEESSLVNKGEYLYNVPLADWMQINKLKKRKKMSIESSEDLAEKKAENTEEVNSQNAEENESDDKKAGELTVFVMKATLNQTPTKNIVSSKPKPKPKPKQKQKTPLNENKKEKSFVPKHTASPEPTDFTLIPLPTVWGNDKAQGPRKASTTVLQPVEKVKENIPKDEADITTTLVTEGNIHIKSVSPHLDVKSQKEIIPVTKFLTAIDKNENYFLCGIDEESEKVLELDDVIEHVTDEVQHQIQNQLRLNTARKTVIEITLVTKSENSQNISKEIEEKHPKKNKTKEKARKRENENENKNKKERERENVTKPTNSEAKTTKKAEKKASEKKNENAKPSCGKKQALPTKQSRVHKPKKKSKDHKDFVPKQHNFNAKKSWLSYHSNILELLRKNKTARYVAISVSLIVVLLVLFVLCMLIPDNSAPISSIPESNFDQKRIIKQKPDAIKIRAKKSLLD